MCADYNYAATIGTYMGKPGHGVTQNTLPHTTGTSYSSVSLCSLEGIVGILHIYPEYEI